MKIKSIKGRQILDSRGNPTVEADVILENGIIGRSAVPSGASTGTNEAVELRDGDKSFYNGKSVLKAVENVNIILNQELSGMDVENQLEIDQKMIDLDGTDNKSKLGANAILAVSLACAKAAALNKGVPLFEYINVIARSVATKQSEKEITTLPSEPRNDSRYVMPVPMMNIINGGKHAASSTDIQEFMILPVGAKSFSHALQVGAEIFHALANVLHEAGYGTTVGDEGGYAPSVKNGNAEALDFISQAIKKAGYKLGEDVFLGLDVASSELFSDSKYKFLTEAKELNSEEMVNFLKELTEEYSIISIEDGLAEDDWEGWKLLTKKIGDKTQLVGDDLFVTNTKFLEKGITEKAGNAILIKVNQIGTLTETIKAVQMAKDSGWNTIISHRSGETEDTTIAHIAVGLNAGQIKTGSLSRTDRIAKYNELLRIEELLGEKATYPGKSIFEK